MCIIRKNMSFEWEEKMQHKYLRFLLTMAFTLASILSACASVATIPTVLPTPTTNVTDTPQPTVTKTSTPTITPSPTVTPDLAATQQHEGFLTLMQKYHDAGQISTTEGEYVKLEDYEHSLANKLSYEWTETGVK